MDREDKRTSGRGKTGGLGRRVDREDEGTGENSE